MIQPDGRPPNDMTELIEEASAKTGLSAAEIEALVNSELDTDNLLEYLSAVIRKRMN